MSHPLDKLWLNVDQPSRMILRSPGARRPLVDKEKKEAYVDVYSRDSAVAKKYWESVDDKATPEERIIGYLVAITAGWYLVGADGTPVDFPFSPANAKILYSHPGGIDIADQVGEYAKDRANFLPALSSS